MAHTHSFQDLLAKVHVIINSTSDRDDVLGRICTLLEDEVPHYNWVGFYLVDPDADRELVLGPTHEEDQCGDAGSCARARSVLRVWTGSGLRYAEVLLLQILRSNESAREELSQGGMH